MKIFVFILSLAVVDSFLTTGYDTMPVYGLDIGCGTGESTMIMSQEDRIVVGIDKNERVIREAKQRYGSSNRMFLTADASKPVFGSDTFDVIQMRFCMLHLHDMNRVVPQVWRIMRDDGRLVVTDYDTDHPYMMEVMACPTETWRRMNGKDPFYGISMIESMFDRMYSQTRDGIYTRIYRKKKQYKVY
ncbi:MAG: class I SAM-dependent methyltransferase [Alphaproteobacteria bacterium]|nr:class I SAM-dependent methyltransferase [Alphaproteobacteria bacterium]